MQATDNIVQVASKAGSFGTLLAAAKAAGLVGALEAEGPMTVFAPTDDAFAKLPAGTVETLLKPENKEQLKSILLYHVVEGEVTSEQVVKLTSAKTLQGQKAKIAVKDGKVYVDGAQVIKADVPASNGVIHVIDSVILPSK
ncbi:MAG: fasciclin domain-containing protein [marine benthic group bacterium]|nr:fasciclin domain-containing protein [Gemmatimonadota bacterium]